MKRSLQDKHNISTILLLGFLFVVVTLTTLIIFRTRILTAILISNTNWFLHFTILYYFVFFFFILQIIVVVLVMATFFDKTERKRFWVMLMIAGSFVIAFIILLLIYVFNFNYRGFEWFRTMWIQFFTVQQKPPRVNFYYLYQPQFLFSTIIQTTYVVIAIVVLVGGCFIINYQIKWFVKNAEKYTKKQIAKIEKVNVVKHKKVRNYVALLIFLASVQNAQAKSFLLDHTMYSIISKTLVLRVQKKGTTPPHFSA